MNGRTRHVGTIGSFDSNNYRVITDNRVVLFMYESTMDLPRLSFEKIIAFCIDLVLLQCIYIT